MEENEIDTISFEEIASALGKEDLPLDESLKLFKRGVLLYRGYKEFINSAFLTAKEVLGDLEKEMKFDGSPSNMGQRTTF